LYYYKLIIIFDSVCIWIYNYTDMKMTEIRKEKTAYVSPEADVFLLTVVQPLMESNAEGGNTETGEEGNVIPM